MQPITFNPPRFLHLVKFSHSFQNSTLKRDGASEVVYTAVTSPNYFDVIRARALLGDVYHEETALSSEPRPALLSYQLWNRFFQGDASVVGQEVLISDRFYRIVGVMDASFSLPNNSPVTGHQLFLPISRYELPQEALKSRWHPTIR